MITMSKITGVSLASLKRRLKVLIYGKDIMRETAECAPYGYDASPVNNIKGFYTTTASNGEYAVMGYINQQQKSEVGESRVYSTDSTGAFKYNVWVRNNGTVLIGSSDNPADYTNFLTKFNELKTGFDTLKNNFNTFVTTYNGHTHAETGGTTGPPTPTGTTSTASIDSSKAITIKTN